jgi:hypothetical protein
MITDTPRKAGPFTGNGTATAFPFAFKVFQASDVLVVSTDPTGAETVLTLATNYTVALNSDQDVNPGGTVTLVGGALATGYNLTLASRVPDVQPAVFTNQGGFFPRVLNDSLDRLTILVQQLREVSRRSLRLPISAPANVSVELPKPIPGNYLAWNSTGTQLTSREFVAPDGYDELGYKSMKQNDYTGASTLLPADNGKAHRKTDNTQVTVLNTLPLEFLSTIVNHSATAMPLVFSGCNAIAQGSDDVTPSAAWSLAPYNTCNLVKIADGVWYISGKVSKV